MAIKITHYTPMQSQGACKGIFSCYIEEWDLHFRGLKEIVTSEGKKFIGFPQKEYTDKNGEKKYLDYVSFGKETGQRFQAKLRVTLAAYKEAKGLNHQHEKMGDEVPF